MSHNKYAVSYKQVINFDAGWKYCLYCVNCTKFGKLILTNIIEIVANRCQNLRLKCTEFDFGSASDPAGKLPALPQNL